MTNDFPRHLASLYLDDLADAIRDGVDPRFGFARYAEHLAVAAPRFEPLRRALEGRPTLVDRTEFLETNCRNSAGNRCRLSGSKNTEMT